MKRLIDADALSEKLCETTIFIKDGEVFQRMINDAPTVQAKDDLISRQDAIKNAHFPVIDDASYEVVRVDDILALPSAEPKTGKWEQVDLLADRLCSVCGYGVWDSEAEEYNFCPNCGAKMGVRKDE